MQAPAAAPVDAYGTLQLLPSAPHDLIERAYWALVSRAKQRGPGAERLRLGDLNDAYATLINPERRAIYDEERGYARARFRQTVTFRRRGLLSRRVDAWTRLNHYELLHVTPDASADVIDAAYGFRCTQLMGSDIRLTLERRLVDEAYTTLVNAQRRAQYDAKTKIRPGTAVSSAADALDAAGEGADDAASRPAAGMEPAATDVAEAVAAGAAVDVAVDATQAPARTPISARRWPAFLRRTAERREADRAEHRRLIEAEQQRLRELGLAGEPPLPASEPEELETESVACFRFVDGPQAGQVVELSSGSLILGASESADVELQNPDGMIGPGHVRVWHRESDFLLHQLDSFSTTFVNGERLDLRIVILEPGDEVRIGPHVMVFERAATPVAPPASATPAQA
jgi:curved DNA-binding protein CbpA